MQEKSDKLYAETPRLAWITLPPNISKYKLKHFLRSINTINIIENAYLTMDKQLSDWF